MSEHSSQFPNREIISLNIESYQKKFEKDMRTIRVLLETVSLQEYASTFEKMYEHINKLFSNIDQAEICHRFEAKQVVNYLSNFSQNLPQNLNDNSLENTFKYFARDYGIIIGSLNNLLYIMFPNNIAIKEKGELYRAIIDLQGYFNQNLFNVIPAILNRTPVKFRPPSLD